MHRSWVPLLVVDGKSRGQVSRKLVSTVDLVPAMCAMADVEIPFYCDGHNFLSDKEERKCCLTEYRNGFGTEDFSVYAAVGERYKLIRFDNGRYECSDLVRDPAELQNFAEDSAYAGVVRELTEALLTEIMRTSGTRFPQICGY